MSKHECKELREAVVALGDLGGFIAKRSIDGVDLGDAIALMRQLFTDDDFQKKFAAAVADIQKIPSEFAEELRVDGVDGAIAEGFELGSAVVQEFMKSFKEH